MLELNRIYLGDCTEVLKEIDDSSIDLIITSPLYADRRRESCGEVKENDYVEWFDPKARELKRVLKPTGSFFLNIKPHTRRGERSLYVFDLVCHLQREVGFMFAEEYCWIKNPFPTGTHGRFKNAFEPVYHFTKEHPRSITFNATACGKFIQDGSIDRACRKDTGDPDNLSKMRGVDSTNILNLEMTRPSNVIRANNVSNQFMLRQHHPAPYPEELVKFFVMSFSNEDDVVLDPFVGSGTTSVISYMLGRKYIGIDIDAGYCLLSEKRIEDFDKHRKRLGSERIRV